MADSSDVEKALVALIAGIVYPDGVQTDPTQNILGVGCRVKRGWPDGAELDEDLRNGIVNITVYPRPNMERNTTRYRSVRKQKTLNTETYALVASGQTVTVTGSPPGAYFAQNLAVTINGYPYLYQATAGQTAAQVAAALVAAIQIDFPSASISGAVISLPATARLGQVIVGTTGTTIREVRRQEKHYQVAFWCPSPDLRDAAVSAIDPALSDTPFLTLADGGQARMIYSGSMSNDAPEKELLFRRDLFFSVEYAVTRTETATQIVAPTVIATDFSSEALFQAPAEPAAQSSFGELDFGDADESGLHPGL